MISVCIKKNPSHQAYSLTSEMPSYLNTETTGFSKVLVCILSPFPPWRDQKVNRDSSWKRRSEPPGALWQRQLGKQSWVDSLCEGWWDIGLSLPFQYP